MGGSWGENARSELEIGPRDNVSGTGLERGKRRAKEEGPIGRNGAWFGTGGREKERREEEERDATVWKCHERGLIRENARSGDGSECGTRWRDGGRDGIDGG